MDPAVDEGAGAGIVAHTGAGTAEKHVSSPPPPLPSLPPAVPDKSDCDELGDELPPARDRRPTSMLTLRLEEPAPHARTPALKWSRALLAQLVLWSGLGVLVRVGLLRLHSYADPPVAAILYPQVVGCLIMGWVDRNKRTLARRFPDLLVGLSTGFCGSITTFSSFALAAFTEFAGVQRLGRPAGDNVLAGLAMIGLTVGMSVAACQAGSNLADLVPALDLSIFNADPTTSTATTATTATTTTTTTAIGATSATAATAAAAPQEPRMSDQRGESELPLGSVMQRIDALVARAGPDWLVPLVLCAIVYVPGIAVSFAAPIGTAGLGFALLFAPVGTLLRYALSRFNSAVPGFPMGTFTVNTVGSAMLFLLFTLRGVVGGTGSPMVCALLVGLSDGLCGCLTTISTFAMELQRLPTRQAYIYFVASVASALMLGIVLTGSWLWANPDGAVLGVCSA